MTSQPDKAKYCSDAHRVYAWRARRRDSRGSLSLAAGMGLEGEFVTTRVVTD